MKNTLQRTFIPEEIQQKGLLQQIEFFPYKGLVAPYGTMVPQLVTTLVDFYNTNANNNMIISSNSSTIDYVKIILDYSLYDDPHG